MQEIDAANAAAAAANGHANGNSSPQLTSKQSNLRLHQTVSIFSFIDPLNLFD
jgi:hypothetical protein